MCVVVDEAVAQAAVGEGARCKMNFKQCATREFMGHKKKVHSVAWNCNGKRLASGSVDQTARVWNIDPQVRLLVVDLGGVAALTVRSPALKAVCTLTVVHLQGGSSREKDFELAGHTDSVDQLCFDPTHPDRLATASADMSVKLWDCRTGKSTATVSTTGENINISWSPDGHTLAVGNKDDVVALIDARKNTVFKSTKFPYEVNEMSWNLSGNLFFLTTGQGTVEVLKYPTFETYRTLQVDTEAIRVPIKCRNGN